METKHTPGPWAVDRDRMQDDCYAAISSGTWFDLATVVVRWEHAKQDCPEGLANADLIAAAPELLEQLQFAVNLLRPLVGGTAQIEAMEAAIKKATGQ